MQEALKEMKQLLSKERVKNKLVRRPNANGEYKFYIGDTKAQFIFEKNYLHCQKIKTTRPYNGEAVPCDKLVIEYLKLIAKHTPVSFITIGFYNGQVEDYLQSGFIPLDKAIFPYVNKRTHFLYSKYEDDFTNHISLIRALSLFLKRTSRKNKAFRFEPISGNFLWGMSYYYKGFNGIAYLELSNAGVFLKEDTIGANIPLSESDNLFSRFKELLLTTEEHTRFENLINPNNQLFIERFSKEGIKEHVSEKVFEHIISEKSFEDFEELIPTAPLVSARKTSEYIRLVSFFGYLIVFHSYDKQHPVTIFEERDREEAFAFYKKMSLISFEETLEDGLSIFKKS